METEQFNIRMPKQLLKDLVIIEKVLKINKSEWVKNKLAQTIYEEKKKLLFELSSMYANGLINKSEVELLVGAKIADEMEFIKKKSEESLEEGLKHGRDIKKKVRI